MKGETRKEDVKQNEKKVKTISVLIFTFSKLVQTLFKFQIELQMLEKKEMFVLFCFYCSTSFSSCSIVKSPRFFGGVTYIFIAFYVSSTIEEHFENLK